MAPRSFRELQCWQIADSLRQEVNAICAKPPISRDLRFCDSFRETAGSVCRNLAEGFVRYRSADIVQFFTYALASRAELEDHFAVCLSRNAVSEDTRDAFIERAHHARATALAFMRPHVKRIEENRKHKRKLPARSTARRTQHVARSTWLGLS